MATTTANKEEVKTPVAKAKKPAPAANDRVNEILKRAALQGKITADELDNVAALANSLKVFLQS